MDCLLNDPAYLDAAFTQGLMILLSHQVGSINVNPSLFAELQSEMAPLTTSADLTDVESTSEPGAIFTAGCASRIAFDSLADD
jgi:hypothetical protein